MRIFFLIAPFINLFVFSNTILTEDKIKNLINEEKKILKNIKKKEISILKEIDHLQKDLFKSDTELVKIRHQLKAKNKKLEELNKILNQTERKIEAQRRIFFSIANKINKIYGQNNIVFLELFFNSENFDTFRRTFKLSQIYIDSYFKLYNQLTNSTQKRKEEISQIKNYSDELSSLQENNFKLSNKSKQKRKTLISLLKKIESEKMLHLKLLEELKEAQTNLDKEIDSLKNKENQLTGLTDLQGKLMFPFQGKIIQSYGRQVNRKFNTIHFNKGITMNSKDNYKIRAIYNGTVAFSEWFKGYENLIIINHGNNYYSLYAKTNKLLKNSGDHVKEGEIIAYAGKDESDMYLFYFELRKHKNTLNPNVWLKRKE